MTKDFSFSTTASTSLTETIALDTSVNGVSLTVEFSNYEDFRSIAVTKTVTGSGNNATVTLSAGEVESLHGGYHRVKSGSTVLESGRVYYTPSIPTNTGITGSQIAADPVVKAAFARQPALRAFNQGLIPAISGPLLNTQATSSNTVTDTNYWHRYYAVISVTEVVLIFNGWTVDSANPNPFTITAAVSNDTGTTFRQVTFNGSASVVINPDADVVSDPISLEVAAGGTLEVNVHCHVAAAGQTWPLGHVGNNQNSATDNTLTSGHGWHANFGQYGYGPSTILGSAIGQRILVAAIGDSQMAGETDSPTTTGGFQTGLQNAGIPFVKISKGGETAATFGTATSRRRRSKLYTGATHALHQHGTNDLPVVQTTSGAANNMISAWKSSAARGMKVYQTTITPRTSSTDTYATTTNQTPVAGCGQPRIDLNNWLRAGAPIDSIALTYVAVGTPGALLAGQAGHPLTGYVEVADTVESSRNSGVWKVGSVNTTDGVHPNSTGHAAIATVIKNWASTL